MVILKVVKIEFSVLNPGLSLRFQVARYMQIIGEDLNSKEILLVQSAFVLFPMKVARGHTGSRTQPAQLGNSLSLALSDFPVNPVGYQPLTPQVPPAGFNYLYLMAFLPQITNFAPFHACHSSTSIYKCDEGNLLN